MSKQVVAKRIPENAGSELAARLGRAVMDLMARIPATEETIAPGPEYHAQRIAHNAAHRAALTAGTLALPPGAFGWLTLIPELVAIWRIQAQMVADIAGVHGKSAELGREQMLFCLFRHATAQALRDVAVQVGGRVLIQDVPARALERIARSIGMRLSQRLVRRGIARWLPLIGAAGVGAYAWYDTLQVAKNARAIFAPVDDPLA